MNCSFEHEPIGGVARSYNRLGHDREWRVVPARVRVDHVENAEAIRVEWRVADAVSVATKGLCPHAFGTYAGVAKMRTCERDLDQIGGLLGHRAGCLTACA